MYLISHLQSHVAIVTYCIPYPFTANGVQKRQDKGDIETETSLYCNNVIACIIVYIVLS